MLTLLDLHDESPASLSFLLEEATAIPGIPFEPLAALRKKLAEQVFNLVVVGEFKRGKSTIINALLGQDVLPTGVVPLTSVVTLLQYGTAADASATFNNGGICSIPLASLPEYVTEAGNPKNEKNVLEVLLSFPSEWLKEGVRLVDTPGIGSVHQQNTVTTQHYLPQVDAIIFVASVDQPLSRAELDFLVSIQRHAGKIFCLLNKMDYLTATELDESLAFVSAALHKTLDVDVPVFAVSARRALQGKMTDDPALWEGSGFAAFDGALRRFLQEERKEVWLHSVHRQLLWLLSETRLSLELELHVLSAPLKQLNENLAAFSSKKRESEQAQSDIDALLDAEGRKLVKQQVEPDLAAFKLELLPRLESKLIVWYEQLRTQGSTALRSGLEEQLILEVRNAFDSWRTAEDKILSDIFENLCTRFWHRSQENVNELLRYSANLFAVSFTAMESEAVWNSPTTFHYKFWEEPPSLQLLTDAVVKMLPGRLGHPLILRRAQWRATELADMQSGRLRHNFEQRIQTRVSEFRCEMRERAETIVAGIEAAIEKGRTLRAKTEDETALRRQQLAVSLQQIENLEAKLRIDQ